jgi:hypothetical protein
MHGPLSHIPATRSCRPIGTDPMAFAASSSVNYYGATPLRQEKVLFITLIAPCHRLKIHRDRLRD